MSEAAAAKRAPAQKRTPAKAPQAKARPSSPLDGSPVLAIEVEVQFVLGHAEVPVGQLMELAEDTVLRMDRAAGEPVDIVVHGTRLAEGELIEDDDGLGVRITRIHAEAADG